MKHSVTRVKSLRVCLQGLRPFIRDGEHLQTGKPFRAFGGMRSREMLANWLLCVVRNFESGADTFTFTTDPLGGDGLIHDRMTGNFFRTEHVMVPRVAGGKAQDAGALVLKAIQKKHAKGGKAYASGKSLVVFLNAGLGEWHPNRVARQLPKPFNFVTAWVVGLQCVENAEYVYGATLLDLRGGNAPMWFVRIMKNFCNWGVARIQ